MRKLGNWLDSWLEFTDNSEPPELFKIWTGISTICACLQRKCYLQWDSRIYPNMYIVLVGPSGCRKGTAMGPAYGLLDQLGIKMAAEAITREALIRELKNSIDNSTSITGPGRVTVHSSLTIFSQELTVFLGYHNLQLISDLTDWYDCRSRWTYRTKNMGTDDITGVWVNILGGTTPESLASALPEDAIGGGLTSRIIFVYGDRPSKLVPLPLLTQKEAELLDKLAYDLEVINAMCGEFRYTEAFASRYVDWYLEHSANPPFDSPQFTGYNSRRPTHLRKLCMALSAARSSDMVLTDSDFEQSLDLLIKTEQQMPKAFGARGRSDVSDIIQEVMQRLQLFKRIPVADLMQRYWNHISRDELDKILRTLEGMNFARIVISGKEQFVEYIPREERNNTDA